jgi:hypothetical protein
MRLKLIDCKYNRFGLWVKSRMRNNNEKLSDIMKKEVDLYEFEIRAPLEV